MQAGSGRPQCSVARYSVVNFTRVRRFQCSVCTMTYCTTREEQELPSDRAQPRGRPWKPPSAPTRPSPSLETHRLQPGDRLHTHEHVPQAAELVARDEEVLVEVGDATAEGQARRAAEEREGVHGGGFVAFGLHAALAQALGARAEPRDAPRGGRLHAAHARRRRGRRCEHREQQRLVGVEVQVKGTVPVVLGLSAALALELEHRCREELRRRLRGRRICRRRPAHGAHGGTVADDERPAAEELAVEKGLAERHPLLELAQSALV
mmetsp:Transcript_30646/g.79586  ORF Transcript_30646/g.79586 Transcript_30646/m.79586 type:complete len:265 (-) Transcript_30646:872-1666(-)